MFKSAFRTFALTAAVFSASAIPALAQFQNSGMTSSDVIFYRGNLYDVSGHALPSKDFRVISNDGGSLISNDGGSLQSGDILVGGMAAFTGRHIFAAGEKRPIMVKKVVHSKVK